MTSCHEFMTHTDHEVVNRLSRRSGQGIAVTLRGMSGSPVPTQFLPEVA